MKTACIMEGGGMRGLFTAGIVDVFLENKVTFDGAAGLSAGICFGCNLKSEQIGRALRYNKRFCGDRRYASLYSLLTTGDLFNVDFCYHQIPDVLDVFDRETFRKNPMEIWAGATDVQNGKSVYHRCTDGGAEDIEWMRASASMPLVSRVVRLDGMELLDGGIMEAVPLHFMEEQGYDRNIVILTQPLGYVKKKNELMPLIRLMLRKYPKLVEAMATRHERYNRQTEEIERREKAGELLVLRPPEALGISRTEKNPDELERVYRIGRSEAERRLTEIRNFLTKSKTD